MHIFRLCNGQQDWCYLNCYLPYETWNEFFAGFKEKSFDIQLFPFHTFSIDFLFNFFLTWLIQTNWVYSLNTYLAGKEIAVDKCEENSLGSQTFWSTLHNIIKGSWESECSNCNPLSTQCYIFSNSEHCPRQRMYRYSDYV